MVQRVDTVKILCANQNKSELFFSASEAWKDCCVKSTNDRIDRAIICRHKTKHYFVWSLIRHVDIVSWSCPGPLAPRGAVGARHDGLPRQFSPLLPVVCHGLSLSEGFAGPLCDVITPVLFRPAPSSTAFDCSL